MSDNFSTISTTEEDSFSASDLNEKECPAIYTENLGWLPLLILMVYIFFFNLVIFNFLPRVKIIEKVRNTQINLKIV